MFMNKNDFDLKNILLTALIGISILALINNDINLFDVAVILMTVVALDIINSKK